MRIPFPFLVLALALATVTTPIARAVPCVLLTQTNELITFDSANPAGASAAVTITGLGSFDLVGIDVRSTIQSVGAANPGVGSLWALGVDGANTRIFIINPTTAVATPVGPVLAGIDGTGSGDNGWFFGHHPGTDRFRLINFKKNYELNPNTITFTPQTELTGNPNLNGSAFETASFGQASKIFFVEQTGDALYTSPNIANGTYTHVGNTGLSFSLGAGLDIVDNTTLFATTVGGSATLYSVNRSTGVATLIGAINGNPAIRALTIQPTAAVILKVKGKKKFTTSSRVKKLRGTASSQAGIKQVDVRIKKGKIKKAKGTTRWSARVKLKPGLNRVTVQATGNNLILSKPARVKIIRK